MFTPSHRGGSGPPLVCLHGFTDTWRTWELALPALERHHEVLGVTLAGHAGGPPIPDDATADALVDAVEDAMDDAGFGTAHIAGNSLGGFLALRLAARGRAKSVVALAPAGGWADGDESFDTVLTGYFTKVHEALQQVAPHAQSFLADMEGRRRATLGITVNYEHIPVDLLAHQMLGAAACDVDRLQEIALRDGWQLDAERITCPVRVVWGTDDQLLQWPSAAARFRNEWLPQAEWVELDGVGHCPQLDVPLETAELILGLTALTSTERP